MSFNKTVFLPVDPDTAFALITEPERLRRWKTIAARVDLRLGGDYRWTVTPGHIAAGTFREIEPGKRVVYTWGWEGSDELPPPGSRWRPSAPGDWKAPLIWGSPSSRPPRWPAS